MVQSVNSEPTDNGIIVVIVHVLFLPSFLLYVQESAEVTSADLPCSPGGLPTNSTLTSSVPSAGMVIFV